jgi:hypothetical protein
MNTHETISQMRALKLMGMANAYQTLCELPVWINTPAHSNC